MSQWNAYLKVYYLWAPVGWEINHLIYDFWKRYKTKNQKNKMYLLLIPLSMSFSTYAHTAHTIILVAPMKVWNLLDGTNIIYSTDCHFYRFPIYRPVKGCPRRVRAF
jgi:hypothetical protein